MQMGKAMARIFRNLIVGAITICSVFSFQFAHGAENPRGFRVAQGLFDNIDIDRYFPPRDNSKDGISPPSAEPGRVPARDLLPEYGPMRFVSTYNKAAVRNGPTVPVVAETKTPIVIRSIRTYHWNSGRGRVPGAISVEGAGGKIYGPWQAEGLANLSGELGPPFLYWLVKPNVFLEAGKYRIIDSDPATWSTNSQAHNRGFFKMGLQEVEMRRAEPIVELDSDGNQQGQATQPVQGKRYKNPMIGEFRLDWCLRNQKNCGKATADEFCRFWDMNEAISFTKADNIGKYEPTREILDGGFCEKPTCDGFTEIVCR
jgi:hypothetical protein